MELRPLSEPGPLGGPLAPVSALIRREAEPRKSGERSNGQGGGDAFLPSDGSPLDAAPFWLVRMSSDRLAQRRYLSERERKALAKLERRFLDDLLQRCGPVALAWRQTLKRGPGLADHQRLVSALCATAGLPNVRIVAQGAIGSERGQYLFRVDGPLIQLRVGAPGSPAEWCATVAHETYHHFQQALVVTLYQGSAPADPRQADMARYYRDARNTYRALGPAFSADKHAQQDLERGAWAFGRAIAQAAQLHSLERP